MSISSAFRELTGKDWIEGIGIAASVAGVLLTIGYQGGQIREELSLAKTELVGVKQELAALKAATEKPAMAEMASQSRLHARRVDLTTAQKVQAGTATMGAAQKVGDSTKWVEETIGKTREQVYKM